MQSKCSYVENEPEQILSVALQIKYLDDKADCIIIKCKDCNSIRFLGKGTKPLVLNKCLEDPYGVGKYLKLL